MRTLQFKATENFRAYDGRGVFFRDGDVKEVSDETAEYLLNEFPQYFTEVKVKTREMKAPVVDRQIKTAKTRRGK